MPEIIEEVPTTEAPEATEVVKEIPEDEVHPIADAPEEPVQRFRYTPENVADAVQPQEVLHEATDAAQKTYEDTVAKAKQDRDEAVKAAQKQYELSLKEYNAAVEAASRR